MKLQNRNKLSEIKYNNKMEWGARRNDAGEDEAGSGQDKADGMGYSRTGLNCVRLDE